MTDGKEVNRSGDGGHRGGGRSLRQMWVVLGLSIGLLVQQPSPVWAQSEASLVVSALPVASVVASTGVAAGSAATVSVVPVALTVSGAVLVVKSIQASARGTIWVLERASDGAQVSIELSGKTGQALSATTGALLTVGVVSTGVVLSMAGELLCFIPNEMGRALFHHERLTQ